MREEIINKIKECYEIFYLNTGIKIPEIPVKFSLRSSVSGTYTTYRDTDTNEIFKRYLSFNMVYASYYREEFLNNTVIHEICHYINDYVNNSTGHNLQWKLLHEHFKVNYNIKHSYKSYKVLKQIQNL